MPIPSVRELAALGPYFAVDMHNGTETPQPPWRPLSELLDAAGWQGRISAVRDALATRAAAPGALVSAASIPLRVATSVAQLGVVARLVAPALGAAVAQQNLLALGPAGIWWQDRLGGPFPLSVQSPSAVAPGQILTVLADRLVGGLLTRIVTVTAELSVSPQILWGNVASALNGAAAMIGTARPDLATEAVAAATALLATPSLEAGWQGRVGADFQRRSCCLIYQLSSQPRRSICGDCVLR